MIATRTLVAVAMVLAGTSVGGRSPEGNALAAEGMLTAQTTTGPTAAAMREAARDLIASVPKDHHGQLLTGWDDPERFVWAYTPVARKGFPLLFMDEAQRALAWKLVDAGLGERGRRQAREIVMLEETLFAASGQDDRRSPDRYFVTLFGAPGALGSWSWRFEGHHLSLNFTVRDGSVVGTTPAFFGGSPARVRGGLHAGLAPFAQEEDLARALVLSLPPEQQRRAVIAAQAPADILTGNDVPAARPAAGELTLGELAPAHRGALLELLGLYAGRLAPDLAAAELEAIRNAGLDKLRFTWAGSLEPGQPHYYQIQGPTFVVEYDNTQNDANHVHSVWRNFERDHGNDPLRDHLAAHHATSTARHRH